MCEVRGEELCKRWSSQGKAWKKLGLVRDSNPWPLRYQCSALPQLSQQAKWEQVVELVRWVQPFGL